MAKAARSQLVKKAGTTIAGVQTKSISFDDEPIDITTDDSAGFQTLLDVSGNKVCGIDVSGVCNGYVLRDIATDPAGSGYITDLSFTFAAGTAGKTVITGNWYMTNYKEDGEYKDSVKFSATFTSSGAWARA